MRDYKGGQNVDTAVPSWEAKNRLQVALYMLAVGELLDLRAAGGVYVPLAGRTTRPRGMLLDEMKDELGKKLFENDFAGEEELEAELDRARERVVELAGRMRTGEIRPCPDTCAWHGGCSYPSICRWSDERPIDLTPSSARRSPGATGRCSCARPRGAGRRACWSSASCAGRATTRLPVDRVLAITFTEKAAAELRRACASASSSSAGARRARQAETASISTIHGFCARLLRSHALAAGIDPDFRVLDETDAARLSFDAFDVGARRLPRDQAATPDGRDPLELAASYGPDKLRAMVVTVHGKLRSQGHRAPAARRRPAGARGGAGAARRGGGGRAGGAGRGRRVGDVRGERAVDALGRCVTLLRAARRAARPRGPQGARGHAGQRQGDADSGVRRVAEAYSAYVAAVHTGTAAKHHALLRRLLEMYAKRYAALKDERSALDFDDLELLARDLLATTRRSGARSAAASSR